MNILLFGATGSAGGAVLAACLQASVVTEVRAITRKPLLLAHPKLRKTLHADFLDYTAVAGVFDNVDACLFCLGVSVTQVSKQEYRKITSGFTLAAARTLKSRRPGASFHYISGRGTSEHSRLYWAQVKAQTELELMNMVDAVCWRPAFIDAPPSPTLPKLYAACYPVLRLLKPFPTLYVSGRDLGRAMLEASVEHQLRRIIENPEIRQIAARATF